MVGFQLIFRDQVQAVEDLVAKVDSSVQMVSQDLRRTETSQIPMVVREKIKLQSVLVLLSMEQMLAMVQILMVVMVAMVEPRAPLVLLLVQALIPVVVEVVVLHRTTQLVVLVVMER
jgi:hypothetical protein